MCNRPDCRKNKMIVLQELDNLDSSLKFIKADGAVDNKKKVIFLMRMKYKEAESLKVKICSEYRTPDIPFTTRSDNWKY